MMQTVFQPRPAKTCAPDILTPWKMLGPLSRQDWRRFSLSPAEGERAGVRGAFSLGATIPPQQIHSKAQVHEVCAPFRQSMTFLPFGALVLTLLASPVHAATNFTTLSSFLGNN